MWRLLVVALLVVPASPAAAQGFSAPEWLKGLLPNQAPTPPADPLAALGLTDTQRAEISALSEQQARAHFEIGQQIASIQVRLQKLYSATRLDEAAIDEAYGRIAVAGAGEAA